MVACYSSHSSLFSVLAILKIIHNCSGLSSHQGLSRATECLSMATDSKSILQPATNILYSLYDSTGNLPQQESRNLCPTGCNCKTDRDEYHVACVIGGLVEVPGNLSENTTFLDLSFNNIETISNESFQTLQQLRRLSISLNRNLRHLGDNWFSGLRNLETLCLWSNPIRTIRSHAFAGLESLQVLDLSDCIITQLPNFVFSPLISMTFLSLHTNAIADYLNRLAFKNATNLTTLIASFNKLEHFPDFLDKNDPILPNLVTLDLSGNNIQIIGDEPLNSRSLQKIETLYLNEISIIRYNNSIFAAFPNLRILTLQVAHSKVLRESKVREDEKRLEVMNSQRIMNALEQVLYYPGAQDCIRKIHKVTGRNRNHHISMRKKATGYDNCSIAYGGYEAHKKVLHGCNCSIIFHAVKHSLKLDKLMNATDQSAVIWTFQNMKKLDAIDLSGTDDVILDHETFIDSYNIKTLILNRFNIDNKFNSHDVFKPLTNLTSLQLSGNRIDTVNFSFLPSKLWIQLEEIDLSYNPFSCDCQIMWFLRWLNSTKVKLLNSNDSSAYRCACPRDIKGTHILTMSIENVRDSCFSSAKDYLLTVVSLTFVVFAVLVSMFSIMHKFRWRICYKYFLIKSSYLVHHEVIDEGVYDYDAYLVYTSKDSSAAMDVLNNAHKLDDEDDDSDWVRDVLLKELENLGIRRIFDPETDLSFGREIYQEIANNIGKSRKVLMIVSNAFIKSMSSKRSPCMNLLSPHYQAQFAETKAISEDRFNIVIVLLEEIAPSIMTPRLHLQMQRQTYIEWTEDEFGQKLFWKNLVKALKMPNPRMRNPPPMLTDSIELASC